VNETIIELKEISKAYGEQYAVNRLTLDIYRGEIFGLLGPNGAGKSTTILMMLGLSEPTSGVIKVCGVNSTREPIEVKKRVGYLPDEVGFYEDRTGLENLLFTAQLNRMTRNEAIKQAYRLLENVGLLDAADKKVGAYSRGMRQRLGLADVLIKNPEVIVLDEPTLGIDPEGVRELLAIIKRLSRDTGITVLLSSHHLHQVQQVCDRVGLFVQGRLIAEGDVATLSKNLFKDELMTISVGISGENEEILLQLEQLEGVDSLQKDLTNQEIFHLQCNRDISGRIAKTIIDSGADLTHLRKKEYGLDEIYHRYFEGGEQGAEPALNNA
jgi:ABC-2 type transport system ATP-binding protein